MENSTQRLDAAQSLTFIFDREADIFEILRSSVDLEVKLLIRSHYNRKVGTNEGEMEMEQFLSTLPFVASYELEVEGKKPGRYAKRKAKNVRKARQTTMDVRFGKCQVNSPMGSSHPPIAVYVVEAIETPNYSLATPTHPIARRCTDTLLQSQMANFFA